MQFLFWFVCVVLFCLVQVRWGSENIMLCIKLNECLFGAVPCQWTLRKSDTEWTPAPEWNFVPCFSLHEYAYQRGYFNAGIDFFTVAAKSAQLPAEMWCEHPFPLSDAPFRHHCALGNDPYAEYLYSMYGHSASIGRCMAAWTSVIISSCADCAGVLGDCVDWMLLMWYA